MILGYALMGGRIKHRITRALSGVEMPVVLLFCLLLTSCGLVPNTGQTSTGLSHQQPGNRPAPAVASLQQASFKTTNGPATPLWPPPQEIQTFQSWVPDQTLAAVTKLPGGQHFKLKLVVAKAPPPPGLDAKQAKELADLEDDQDQDEDDKEDVDPGDDEENAKKPYNRRDRVFIPEHGPFTLTFQAGSDYQVVDGDARDGSATVQMPREVLEGFLKVRGKYSREAHGVFPAVTRKISYADPVYYVKQDLSREKKQHQKQTWLRIGNRALPIPSDWRSVDGEKYVLKLNNQGVTRLTMRWFKGKGNQVAQADFPPGLNSIGPSGGEVNLPGVARLVFPAGSLSQPTTVKISQVLQVPSRHILCDNPGWAEDCHYGYEFASAVVKLEPLGMVLSQPAKLYFNLDMNIAGEAHPASVDRFGSSSPTLEPNSWGFQDEAGSYYFESLNKPRIADLRYDDEVLIKKFLYYSRQVTYMPQRWKQNTNGGFGLAQIVEPNPTTEVPTKISEHFWIEDKTKGKLNAQALETVAQALENAHTYFATQLAMPQPKGWYPANSSEKRIRVELFPETESAAEAGAALPAPREGITGLGTLIQMTSCALTGTALETCTFNTSSRKDMLVHELFHAFQFATQPTYTKVLGDVWLLEGSAQYMAAHVVSQNPSTYELAEYDPDKYLDYLDDGQTSVHIPFYNRLYGQSASGYTTVGFWTHLNSPQSVANIVKNYATLPPYNAQTYASGQAVENVTTAFGNRYETYAQAAFLKTPVTLFPTQPMTDVPITVHTLSKTHTSGNPLPIPMTVSPLTTQYVKITPDDAVPEGALTIRLKTLAPTSISLSATQSFPSETFYRPSAIALNAQGTPVNPTLKTWRHLASWVFLQPSSPPKWPSFAKIW